MERNIVKLLGYNIDTFDFESAIEYVKNRIFTNQGAQVVTINPEMMEYGLKNHEFANVVNNSELIIPDGIGVKIGLKLKGIEAKRIAGIEFSYRLLEECAKNNIPVAFVGAKPRIVRAATKKLQSKIENLNIVYYHDGYFANSDDVQWAMGEKNPRVILVALGSPKQEKFIQEYRTYHPEVVMIGVGGSFDVWSGEVKRAPKIFQKIGMEWFYRLAKEPKRIKRIFPTLPRFLLRVILNG